MRRIWIAAMLVAGMIIGGAANVTARQTHPTPFRGTVHIVVRGESLWSIARAAYPGSDIRAGIERIERANHMRSAAIVAGQRLLIPAR